VVLVRVLRGDAKLVAEFLEFAAGEVPHTFRTLRRLGSRHLWNS
jgi:hypothetical protein